MGNNLAQLALKISKANWQPLDPQIATESPVAKELLEKSFLKEAPKDRIRALDAVQRIARHVDKKFSHLPPEGGELDLCRVLLWPRRDFLSATLLDR